MISRPELERASASTMAVLMLSVFTVSVGFGVVLPLLPFLIERLLGPGGDVTQVSISTGLLSGLYMLSLFLFAPLWGRLSDRFGRRIILVTGLSGFSAVTSIFAFIETLPAVYVERLLSGMFAAAVTPVALATIGDLAKTEELRARQLTVVSLAGISGVLLGPTLGVFVAQGGTFLFPATGVASSLAFPLVGTAILALLVAVAAVTIVPATKRHELAEKHPRAASKGSRWLIPNLLCLAFIVSASVGVFEVGLALRGKEQLGLSQVQIAMMFTTCSLVMIVVQAFVFFSPWVKPATTRWLITPALGVLAVSLFLVPSAPNFTLMLVVIGAVAASAGVLSPILTYWISSKAGEAQGAQLGKQTAAASLGAAFGSAAGGLLFEGSFLPNFSFVLVAALTFAATLLSVRLPATLVTRHLKIGNREHGLGDEARPSAPIKA